MYKLVPDTSVYCAYNWNPDRAVKKIGYGGWKIIGGTFSRVWSPNPATIIVGGGSLWNGLEEYAVHYDEVGYGDDWKYNDPLFYI
ncbi:MAG: hypothetical protein ACP5C3_07040 [Methanomicrobiales archaeon]